MMSLHIQVAVDNLESSVGYVRDFADVALFNGGKTAKPELASPTARCSPKSGEGR